MTNRARRAAPLLAFAASLTPLCLATIARAETTEGEATIIVTAPGARDAAQDRVARVAGGTDIVSHEDYADKSIVSLRDTLAFSPGVYVQPRFGQEVRISIRGSGLSRGFHMRGLTLLQDGVPINLADDNGDFQELDPIFFDHLEVYRGANALRFGSGTLGGAINGVTPTGRTADGLYLRGDGGSFNSVRGLVSAGVADPRVDAWGAISADRSNGDRDHAKRRSFRFHGNVGLALGDRVMTRFYASFNSIKQQMPGALTLADALAAPHRANPVSILGDQARDIESLRLQNRTRFDLGRATLDVGGFVNLKSLYHPIFQVIDQESVDRGGYVRFEYGSAHVDATLGGEWRVGGVRSRRFVNLAGRRGARTYDARQDARTATLYGELRLKPVESLAVIAGGIYADAARRQHERFNAFAGGVVNSVGRASFGAFSPKIGILYEPVPGVQTYANYSRSVEFPGFIELAQTAAFVPLAAQRAWTAEMGTRGQSGAFSWDLSLYRADIKGELLQYDIGPGMPAATFNAGHTRHEGAELAFAWQPTDWLRLRQVYAFSNFRFRGDAQYGNNRLPVVPSHVYRAELRFGSDDLHLAPNLEWVPQGAFADYRNHARVPAYVLFGLTAGVEVAQGVDAFLDVRNLAGAKAIGDISAVVGATPGSIIYAPVESRAVSVGLRTRF